MRCLLPLLFLLTFLGLAYGLTMRTKTHLLEVHNTIRGFIAAGNMSGLGLNFSMPSAANLRAFGWMRRLAKQAKQIQTGMCERQEVQEGWESSVVPDFFVASQRTAVGPSNATLGSLLAMVTAFGPSRSEFLRQPLVLADYMRLGCALTQCNSQTLLTCVYGSERVTQPRDFKQPYSPGQPCSKCPPGNNFCMNNLLCVTSDQCTQTRSRCRCLVQPEKCTADKGQYDALNCRCTCGAQRKVSGLYCSTACKDTNCQLRMTEKQVKAGKKRPAECFNGKLAQRLLLVSNCRLTCNFCREDAFLKIDIEEKEDVPVQMFAKLRYAELN